MSSGRANAGGGRIRRTLIRAALGAALWLGVWAAPATAALPVSTLIRNTAWITAENVAPDANDTCTYDTWVAGWIEVTPAAAPGMVNSGDTVWLPFQVRNRSGTTDSFALSLADDNGWSATLWDSAGFAPLAAVQFLDSTQSLALLAAVTIPPGTIGGLGDSVAVTARSQTDPAAADSGVASFYVVDPLDHFGIVLPATVADGAAFTVTVTAYDDSASHVMTGYDTTVMVTADTGVVAPAALPTGSWVAGVWTGTLTLTGCRDTVTLTFGDGDETATVAVVVTGYLIALDQAAYTGLAAAARVTVTDPAANTDAGVVNEVAVQVVSDADPAGIRLTLFETAAGSGVFTATLAFTQGASRAGAAIQVSDRANVTVTYDPDGAGTASAVTGQATWLAPVVTGLDAVRSWPNPFRLAETSEIIIHRLPSDPEMAIEIYTLAQQRVRTLRVGSGITVGADENLARWDGRNDAGDYVASETYYYLVRSQFGTRLGKLTFIK